MVFFLFQKLDFHLKLIFDADADIKFRTLIESTIKYNHIYNTIFKNTSK